MKSDGFTLVEILITIGIFVILFAATAPTIIKFLGTQNSSDTRSSLVSTLRQARNQALYQKNDASFGVRFSESSYTLFQGSSYASRTTSQDIVITLPTGVTVLGITEVVFEKRTGIPSSTGTITISSSSGSRAITINSQGVIESL